MWRGEGARDRRPAHGKHSVAGRRRRGCRPGEQGSSRAPGGDSRLTTAERGTAEARVPTTRRASLGARVGVRMGRLAAAGWWGGGHAEGVSGVGWPNPRPVVHRALLPAVGMTDAEAQRCAGAVVRRARVGNAGAGRCSAAAEQRTAQPLQRCEERDPPHSRDPAAAVVRGVTRGELAHQRGRLERFALRDGRAAQHREMAVEARTGRAAPARDRRDTCPAAHCYLFHVTPHPYESTRPGQANPIAPSWHSCIAGT